MEIHNTTGHNFYRYFVDIKIRIPFLTLLCVFLLGKITCATEVIVQQLGRKWLQYGRRLGIAENRLEGIQEKHPRNLEEQVRELFKEWKKMRKAEARVDELIRALRSCDLNYTADVVERELVPKA